MKRRIQLSRIVNNFDGEIKFPDLKLKVIQ